jgi:replicative DNA helicase
MATRLQQFDAQHQSQHEGRADGPTGGVTTLMSARQGFRADASHAFHGRDAGRADQRVEQLRIPPQSVEAEQAVLGGLMLAPDAYDRVADILADSDFYRRDHQLIYRSIRELSE